MNILFYVIGSFITFLGIVTYKFISNNASLTLNQANVLDMAITAAIAGVAFFITDYISKKKS